MKKTYLILVIVSILAMPVICQEQSGELIGKVLLADGSAVPGVTVTVKGSNLVGERTTITDENGGYRFPLLPPGQYTVTFSLEGFKKSVRKGIVLEVGKTLKADGVMEVGELKEEVLVEGSSPLVDVRKSSTTTNLTKNVISKLPRGRDFTGIISTQGGVNYESGANTDGYSFDGASSSENTFFVDGMNTTTAYGGVSGQNVNYESVEEVQIKSSGYAAEYGGSMGGVVSVITKSGGNEFHGSALLYYENRSLRSSSRKILRFDPNDEDQNTAEYLEPYKDKGYSIEPGFNIGGYIIKDRLWFFTSLMPRYTKVTRPGYFEGDDAHDKEEFERVDKALNGSIKLTAALSNSLRMNVSAVINNSNFKGHLPEQDGTSSYASLDETRDSGLTRPNLTISGGLDYSLGNNLFLNISAGYYRANQYDYGDLPPVAATIFFNNPNRHLDIADELKRGEGGISGSVNTRSRNERQIAKRKSLKGDMTYYFNGAGEHVVKAGISWKNVSMDRLSGNVIDRWNFFWKNGEEHSSYNKSDGTKVDLDYGYARARIYRENGKLDTDRWAFYLQDSWTIGEKLTINYGVRFEKENMPSFSKDHPEAAFKFDFFDKIAPRVGFSYDVAGDGKNKVFGSFGIYYDVMKLAMAVGSFGGAEYYDAYYNIKDPDWRKYLDVRSWFWNDRSEDPVLDGELMETKDKRVPSFDLVQPDMKPYSKMEISLGYQRILSDDLSFTARFLHNRIINAIEDIGVLIGSDEHYYIGNPGSDWINQKYKEASETPDEDGNVSIPPGRTCPDPKRDYYSVQLSLDKKFSNNWLGGVSLTWSSLKGNFSGLASTDEDNRQDPNVQRYFDSWFLHYDSKMKDSDGVLPTDRPIDFKVYGAYTFDFGLTVGMNGYVRSGTPVSTTILLKEQDGYYPNGRGDLGRTPVRWQVDLYAEYEFKLSEKMNLNLNVNVINLTDNKIATRKYARIVTSTNVELTNDEIVAGYDVDQLIVDQKLKKHPLYNMSNRFMAPMEIRFGAKLSF